MNTCEVCGSETTNKRFCSITCCGRWQKGKTFAEQNKTVRQERICSIENCKRKHFGRGYCRKHYVFYILKSQHESQKKIKLRTCRYCGINFSAYNTTNGNEPKYCSSKCYGMAKKKPYIVKKGYKKILIQDHPRADHHGYVFEHIIIIESILGRPLKHGEVCHHIDGNKMNNTASNLKAFSSHSEHMQEHKITDGLQIQ